ncbi:AAA family ATPase [Bailinhaonella thermotolerans]|uniref:Nuclease SbcCD subunit C n=1 Tax=Bailinhaonella thermotolerans TaxID=1070861 RepID=A0A3A4B6C5_9ACTN|nr:SMC family ATPase [Bailinhaonella thermotolerans]RJL34117.1 SMC family ATPase [Bailinhaonella thermotolerans]
MRLHALRVTAFGSFAGTEEVDFDALSGAGLFLVHGPTGAGKTSVLDAVCFALYGAVPGLRNRARSLHSDHAPRDRAPEVALETTIRGRRLRITRSPAWTRPKLRGEGVTEVKARVLVEELVAGEWVARSTRHDEAGHFIGDLLGMSSDQFFQVALLPQGEFARFLRADAEERRKLLQRLFSIEIFDDVERWLEDHRRETGRLSRALRDEVDAVTHRVVEAAGLPAAAPPADAVRPRTGEPAGRTAGAAAGEAAEIAEIAEIEKAAEAARGVLGVWEAWGRAAPAEPDELIVWAGELAAAAGAELDDALADAVRLREGLDRAREAAEAGRALADRKRRHAEALRRRDALAAHSAEREHIAAALAAAARADRVMPLVRAAEQRAAAADEAEQRAAKAVARALPLIGPVPDGEPGPETLAARERVHRDEIAGLERLREDAARLRAVQRDLREAALELDRLTARERDTAAVLEELPGRRAELEEELSAARDQAAHEGGARAALDRARARLAAAVRRDALAERVAAAAEARIAAVEAAQDARDRLQEIRDARIAGMAAVLAGTLEDGRPCPVCGAEEHPAPAGVHLLPGDGGVPGADEEDLAQSGYDQANDVRTEAEARLAELTAQHEAAEDASEGLSAEAAEAEVGLAEAALAAALGAAEAEAALAERLLAVDAQLAEARDRARELGEAVAACASRRSELTAEAARLAARLDEARGDDPTLEARIDRLTAAAALLADAAEATRRARAAAEERDGATRAAEDAAVQHEFTDGGDADLAAVRRAALPDGERRALADRARDLDDEEAAVRELLADPDLAAASAVPDPDLPALESALRAAEHAAGEAAAARDRAARRRERLGALRGDLADRVAAWRPAADRHAVAERVAALAVGTSTDNRWRMRLSAYVLAARLEQVVAAANDRLGHMSGSRYLLRHTAEKGAADRRGGLGLRVIDAWTGNERDPATLSGGESFITSLALALGLADVVTAEAGGAEIGTLFVDEGFGTLDEDTLDAVLDILDNLRDGGRAVGIVSHVTELRTRIPAQLHVRKTPTGSTLRVIGA